MMVYDFSIIQSSVQRSLDTFLINDKSLLENDVSERTISQNFSNYLKSEFHMFDIDCEFNRHGSDIKTIIHPNETKPRAIFPDIVIHSRGTDANNVLVIEIKKYGNPEIKNDEIKLKELTSESFGYQFGLLMVFSYKRKNLILFPSLRWFF